MHNPHFILASLFNLVERDSKSLADYQTTKLKHILELILHCAHLQRAFVNRTDFQMLIVTVARFNQVWCSVEFSDDSDESDSCAVRL